ncbi:hypothetical protein [Streptomyces sp. NPDC090445]|uniref:hypothetical protein n=1 Tax=Streptomyces sp. NPDC090445 TaxID=3365963 RepID=UPI00381DC84B
MSESSTTAEQRLDRLSAALSGTRAQSRSDRRLKMNRPGNILFGVLLHAAARLDKGLPLTDLEQRLVDAVSKHVPVGELTGFGRVYHDACARGSIAMLPQAITSLPVETGYTKDDLVAATPALIEEINAQPNVRIVDVSKLADDEPIDSEESTAAMAEYGRGTTILTAPSQDLGIQGLLTVRLRMDRFYCVRESSGEAGNDEVYWAVASGSDTGSKASFQVPHQGHVSTGVTRVLPYVYGEKTYLFNGTVDQYLSTEIQCWEADRGKDEGWLGALRRTLADFADHATDASSEISKFYDNETRKAQAWAAFLALGAGLLNAFLGLFDNPDDLVLERSIGFSRDYLISISRMPNRENYYNFDGGSGGYHKLYLRANDLG